ncbi:MAG: Qat anti-phage system QueC-like protein QatC [Dehalococcoidia bacterium]
MKSFQLRTDPGQRPVAGTVLLDWFAAPSASTISVGRHFLDGLAPNPMALDFLRVAGAVFVADKSASRDSVADGWTRDIAVQVPVSDPDSWLGVAGELSALLGFLSGDRWQLDFAADSEPEPTATTLDTQEAVCLFSGGLDSLAGAIELLEEGRDLMLVGHHDSSLTDNRQVELFHELETHYGPGRVHQRRLLLRPKAKAAATTTRSRSILFLAAGIAVADGLSEHAPLVVPENGFIGVNVPLTAARSGSFSTRTTHPYFLRRLEEILAALGLAHPIENPFRLKTKGEVLAESSNRALLARLAPRTVSCSHGEAPRWRDRQQGNCGYCYPCLIRRASMHRVGLDGPADYSWDALTDPTVWRDPQLKTGRDLRALTASLAGPVRPSDVLRNGPIPSGEAGAFFDLYRRGRDEIRAWIGDGADPDLRRRCGLA